MSNARRSVDAPPVPPQGTDRGSLAVVLLVVVIVVGLFVIGTGGQEVRPLAGSVVTIQQPSGWDKLQSAVGLDEPVPEPRGDTPGRRMADGLRLDPRTYEGDLVGYEVRLDTHPAALALTRLRPGDVILDMDGQPLDPDRIDALGDELSLLDAVDVTFLRDGATRKRVINLRSAG
jgi:hypothetical protein